MWPYLPSGGHLAYITCTMNPAENEGQIDAFLARTPGASLEKQWQSTPDAFGSDLMYGAMWSPPRGKPEKKAVFSSHCGDETTINYNRAIKKA